MSAGLDAYESPLVAIERAVQERAKDISLEMSDPGGEAKLRVLIEAEVERWGDDFRHGRRAYDLADPALVVERAIRNMARYGPLTDLLADDDVWEVQVNAPASVFVRRHQGLSGYHDEVFHDDEHVLRTLTKLLDDASSSHRKLDAAEGLQDAQLDDGARVHIVHGDTRWRGARAEVRATWVPPRARDGLDGRTVPVPMSHPVTDRCPPGDDLPKGRLRPRRPAPCLSRTARPGRR